MKKIGQSILLVAYENHTRERRSPAHWRVGIRAHISQDPVELSAGIRLINGIYENNWLRFNDINTTKNLAEAAKIKLGQYLRSHHIEDIEPGRTRNIQPEIFLKLGYVFATSKKLYEKLKADALMQDWKKRGLDCCIIPELPECADLYASEALALTKYADLVKTDHLVAKGHQGRVAGSVELCLMDEDEDIIAKARKATDTAFQSLEKQGLAVQMKGYNLCFKWDGITLTKRGAVMAQKVKDAAYQAFLTEQAAKAEKQCKIKCPSCGEIRLQTTSLFRSDKAVTGIMIELLPGLSQTGWSAKFGPTDTGEAIVCPNCNSVLLDHDSFRFSEGVLVDTEDVEAA